jgi:hypothetical protein
VGAIETNNFFRERIVLVSTSSFNWNSASSGSLLSNIQLFFRLPLSRDSFNCAPMRAVLWRIGAPFEEGT